MKDEIPQEVLDKMKREGWASIEEQQAYWEKKDIGGNVLPDRVQANHDIFTDEKLWEMACSYDRYEIDGGENE